MKQLVVRIGQKQYLISSLKGMSESKFLKEKQGSKEDYEVLKPYINPEVEVKATKKKGKSA